MTLERLKEIETWVEQFNNLPPEFTVEDYAGEEKTMLGKALGLILELLPDARRMEWVDGKSFDQLTKYDIENMRGFYWVVNKSGNSCKRHTAAEAIDAAMEGEG